MVKIKASPSIKTLQVTFQKKSYCNNCNKLLYQAQITNMLSLFENTIIVVYLLMDSTLGTIHLPIPLNI